MALSTVDTSVRERPTTGSRDLSRIAAEQLRQVSEETAGASW